MNKEGFSIERVGPAVAFVLLAAAAGSLAVFVSRGWILGDEGWYCNAAVQILQGRVPYRDFFLAQMPLVPYLLAIPFHVVGPSMELGRIFSACTFGASLLLLIFLTRRMGGWLAAIIAVALAGLNPFILSMVTKPVTTSFECLLLLLCFCALFFGNNEMRKNLSAVLVAVFLVWARLSYAPFLALVVLYLAWQAAPGKRAWALFAYGIAGISMLAIVCIPYYLGSDGSMWFHVYSFHTTDVRIRMPEEILRGFWLDYHKQSLGYFAGFLGAGLIAAWCLIRGRKSEGFGLVKPLELLALATFVVLTIGHILPNISYPKYHIGPAVALVLFAAPVLARCITRTEELRKKLVWSALVAVCLLPNILLPWNLIPPGSKPETEVVRGAAKMIEEFANGQPVLVVDAGLNVQGNLNVLPGFEMSDFSIVPHISKELAQKHHVVNLEMFFSMIEEEKAQVIAFTREQLMTFGVIHGEDLRRLEQILQEHYRVGAIMEGYGDFHSRLYIMVRK